jgi:hypothetical protein
LTPSVRQGGRWQKTGVKLKLFWRLRELNMAEVGLVRFGRLALQVSQAVLPAQRTKFSKRMFTQPQLLAVVDLKRQLILAQQSRQAPWNDCATLPVLVTRAHRQTPIGCVLADAEFDSERKHIFCRRQLKAQSVIPAKRRSSRRASGVRLEMRQHFPSPLYAQRSLIESVFSSVKRKLSARAPGKTIHTQSCQALLLSLAFDLYHLRLPAC